MPYVTPPVYSSSNGYGFVDVNRTNDNVDFIYNTGIKPDAIADISLGFVKVGSPPATNDRAYFAHGDFFTATSFCSYQNNLGASFFNSAAGNLTTFSHNGDITATLSEDHKYIVGSTSIGEAVAGRSYFAHSSFFDSLGYAVYQNNLGDTNLNCASGRTLFLKSNDTSIASLTTLAISLLKPVTVTTNLLINTTIMTDQFNMQGSAYIKHSGRALRFQEAAVNTQNYTDYLAFNNTVLGWQGKYGASDNSIHLESAVSPLKLNNTNGLDIDFGGKILPTTTPTESATGNIASGGTYMIPRGVYSVEGTLVTGGVASIKLEKLINGTWRTVGSTSSSVTVLLSDFSPSTGSDLRISSTGAVTFSSAVLRKY